MNKSPQTELGLLDGLTFMLAVAGQAEIPGPKIAPWAIVHFYPQMINMGAVPVFGLMSVVEIDARGRVTIPKEMRIEADRALVIHMGDSYMVIPIARAPVESDTKVTGKSAKERAERKLAEEVRARANEATTEMIIESDLFVAYSKKTDWLKQYADPIFESLRRNKLKLNTSAAVLIELYYVLEDFGFDKAAVLGKQAEIAGIDGLSILPVTAEVLLAAQSIMKSFKVTGLFDAIYAATALNQDSDRTILSTDEVYDRVPGLTRVDPRKFSPKIAD